MFCARCGNQIVPPATICGKCGAPVAGASAAVDLAARPMLVTLLAILHFISAGFLIIAAAVTGFATMGSTDGNPLVGGIVVFALVVFAVLQLACGAGLWTLQPYGRTLQLVLAFFGLLAFPFGTIISILLLVYFFKPGVKAIFSGKPGSQFTADEVRHVTALQQSSTAAIVVIVVVILVLAIGGLGIVAAIAIPGLLRARMSGNEAAAIGAIRTVQSAQAAYASANGGLYDTLECLTSPGTCLKGYSGPAMLDPSLAQQTRNGYQFRFDPGPAADAETIRTGGHSPSSLASFIYVASPVQPGSTGQRFFCGDSNGAICTMSDMVPRTADGVCPAACTPLR